MRSIFASTAVNPGGADGLLFGGGLQLLSVQAVGVLASAAMAAVGTGAILMALRSTVGLRPSERAERVGLDVSEHAELAYRLEPVPSTITNH